MPGKQSTAESNRKVIVLHRRGRDFRDTSSSVASSRVAFRLVYIVDIHENLRSSSRKKMEVAHRPYGWIHARGARREEFR